MSVIEVYFLHIKSLAVTPLECILYTTWSLIKYATPPLKRLFYHAYIYNIYYTLLNFIYPQIYMA